ncbi:MAG: phosphotransferase [Bifidobacterium crudilactis]|jgi:hypothetical protein|nr:phosphotransferase [Bifidobacterium crudilactis]MCI2148119.1 phosphotransferase [Bifidobacterium crudilactis]MCI2157199.1 phosphotransferase [Bifidobacterium crudilactis]
MPGIAVSGTRSSNQASAGDIEAGIDLAIIQDGPGRLLDVAASNTDEGKARLLRRVKAANTLAQAKEPGGLGFAMERVVAYQAGDNPDGPTGTTSVAVFSHCAGSSVALHALDTQDCIAIGTAIGAIHRLRGTFLQEASYPVFTTENIKQQLLSWISRLSKAGHIPQEIIRSWSDIVNTSGLWSFTTCPVHGGFDDGDFLFSDTTLTAIYNWQDMQINDPARDLAWMFAKLDETRRNALIAAYGRMMGSHLDQMIMLRANLWLQMEQVGEFISALDHADNERILQFKAQVEHLAHQLVARQSAKQRLDDATRNRHAPSTITVGTLLDDPSRVSDRSRQYAAGQATGRSQSADADGQSDGQSAQSAQSSQQSSKEVPAAQSSTNGSPFGAAKENQQVPPQPQAHAQAHETPLAHVDEVEDVSSATIVVSAVHLHETSTHTDAPADTSIPVSDSTPVPVSTAVPDSAPAPNPPSAEHRAGDDAAETIMIPHFGAIQGQNTQDNQESRPDHDARHDNVRNSDADGEQSNPGE